MKKLYFVLGLILFISCTNSSPNKKLKKEEFTQLKLAAWNVEYSLKATAAEIGEALLPFILT